MSAIKNTPTDWNCLSRHTTPLQRVASKARAIILPWSATRSLFLDLGPTQKQLATDSRIAIITKDLAGHYFRGSNHLQAL